MREREGESSGMRSALVRRNGPEVADAVHAELRIDADALVQRAMSQMSSWISEEPEGRPVVASGSLENRPSSFAAACWNLVLK